MLYNTEAVAVVKSLKGKGGITRERSNRGEIIEQTRDKLEQLLLFKATTNAGPRFGRIGPMGGMEIHELGLLKGDLRMTSVVVNLHRLDIRGCGLAERALILGVATLIRTTTVSQTGFASAPIGGSGVDLGGDLLGSMLLGLGLPGHDIGGNSGIKGMPPRLARCFKRLGR